MRGAGGGRGTLGNFTIVYDVLLMVVILFYYCCSTVLLILIVFSNGFIICSIACPLFCFSNCDAVMF